MTRNMGRPSAYFTPRVAATAASVGDAWAQLIAAGAELIEDQRRLRMAHRFVAVLGKKVLFGHIGHEARLIIFGQKVIEGLILPWSYGLGNRQPPLLGV